MSKHTLDFPNETELSNSNSVEFKVFIPSTRNKTIKISNTAFDKRVDEANDVLSKMFGGSTFDVEIGTYQYKEKLIKEKVAVIVVNAKESDYNKYDEKLEDWIRKKKHTWGQDSMGFVYQGNMLFI